MRSPFASLIGSTSGHVRGERVLSRHSILGKADDQVLCFAVDENPSTLFLRTNGVLRINLSSSRWICIDNDVRVLVFFVDVRSSDT